MIPGLIHDNIFEYTYSLVVDLLIFIVKSIYFFAETVFLTILPNKLRKMKVRIRNKMRNDFPFICINFGGKTFERQADFIVK